MGGLVPPRYGSPHGLLKGATLVVDLLFRMAYRCAYRLMRVYWRVAHPRTHGAMVAIWYGGKVMLVRNSYLDVFSMPGGYVQSGETGRQAAVRELREEIALEVTAESLVPVVDLVHEWHGKQDHVEIFALKLDVAPVIKIDNREVVAANFYAPTEALLLPLFPPLRPAIAQGPGEGAVRNGQ